MANLSKPFIERPKATILLSAPFTTFTFDVGHRLAAWIGAPSQLRQELQWQYT